MKTSIKERTIEALKARKAKWAKGWSEFTLPVIRNVDALELLTLNDLVAVQAMGEPYISVVQDFYLDIIYGAPVLHQRPWPLVDVIENVNETEQREPQKAGH